MTLSPLTLQRLVQPLRFFRNRSPTKVFFDSFASGFAKSLAELRISHQLIDALCEIAREFFGIDCLEWAFLHLLKRNKETRFAIKDDLVDSANSTGNYRSFAGHGL